jgi:hypothetical protein
VKRPFQYVLVITVHVFYFRRKCESCPTEFQPFDWRFMDGRIFNWPQAAGPGPRLFFHGEAKIAPTVKPHPRTKFTTFLLLLPTLRFSEKFKSNISTWENHDLIISNLPGGLNEQAIT